MKILIAEDDAVSRRLIESTLSKWGLEVVVAKDGNEAWAALISENAPQMAIIDWMMPGMSGIEVAQIQQIQDHFAIGEDEIDLPTFPLFALFDPALGMTAVIPEMDPRKPAQADPDEIIGPIVHHGVTNMFASPALLNRVGRFGRQNNVHLPSLRRVVSAGAPVSPSNIDQFAGLLSETAEVHTPYGATEAVPIVSIGSQEILSETAIFLRNGQSDDSEFGTFFPNLSAEFRVLIAFNHRFVQ